MRDSSPLRRAALGLLAVTFASAGAPADDAASAPAYSDDGQLLRPADYREWVFVTSGVGMTYGPAKPDGNAPPRFDNVFVTRAAYREFLKSGTWPDRTMFILEVRASEENVSINKGGRTQGGIVALEAAVKDRSRSPEGGWGYFSFDGKDGPLDRAAPLPREASCYSCHAAKAAVDNTFVQFYPELLDVARRLGTLRPGHDPAGKP